MLYERSLSITCEGCPAQLTIVDGTPIARRAWDRETRSPYLQRCVAGEKGQPVPVTGALWFALSSGWVAMTTRNVEGDYRTLREPAEVLDVPIRDLTVVCKGCAGSVRPPYSRSAARALSEMADEDRDLRERIAALEAQVSALTAMREAVAS